MKTRVCIASVAFMALVLAAVSLATGPTPEFVGPIYDGPELDYQPSIIRMEPDNQLMLVFERLSLDPLLGDLHVAFSADGGQSWSVPVPILNSSLNERHPSLVQLAPDSFLLFYLVDETSSSTYRIHRATSSDGLTWIDQGMIDLGWILSGEINPCVIREADGTLTMAYHRLSGASYIAQSADDGVTWDTLKTQVSDGNAQLPRLAKRESDGLYLVTYQVGGSDLDLYAKISANPYDWSGPQIPVSTAINTHDSQPIVLEDGTFLVPFARQIAQVFDLYYRTSCDGLTWSDEVRVTNDTAHYDTQPHPLLHGTLGRLLLTWSHQESYYSYQDHDVWIDTSLQVLRSPTKSAAPTVVGAGDFLTYTLRFPNDRPCAQAGTLFDPIPANTSYVAGSLWASGGHASHDPVECVINWTGTITGGEAITITFQVSTSASLMDGDVVTNTAWLSVGQSAQYTLAATATIDALSPASQILDPHAGQLISDTTYLVSGVASDSASGVDGVAVSVDGGAWRPAAGQESWTLQWEAYGDGEHNLRSQATDGAGNVEAVGPGVTVTVDSTPPELVAYSPVSGAVGVPLSEPLVLTFSEYIETDSLAYAIEPDPLSWTELWNSEGTVVRLYHPDFELGQSYTFSVIQARDRALNLLAPTEWSFTTSSRYRAYLPTVLRSTP